MPRVSVLMPTHNHGQLLRCSYHSLAQQTEQDFELFIICDGATADTIATAGTIAAEDPRVRVMQYPKSPRTGELYRHEVISEQASGEFIAYLSDDDLWFPDHLQRLCVCLDSADFASSQVVCFPPNNDAETYAVDLRQPHYRNLLLGKTNRIPLSAAAHRREAYRGLPYGWRSTPAGIPTDHYMWQQWLGQNGTRFGAVPVATVLNFPDTHRREMTLSRRAEELSGWLARMRTEAGLTELRNQLNEIVVRSLTTQVAQHEQDVALNKIVVAQYEQEIANRAVTLYSLLRKVVKRLRRAFSGKL